LRHASESDFSQFNDPILMEDKIQPGVGTSRPIGEGAGTSDGAFGASFAGLEHAGFDRRVKSASSRSTLSASAMALAQSD